MRQLLVLLLFGTQIAMCGRRLHILMVPWLAFGHLLPFLELSKALAEKGHRISFLTTPRNIKRLIPAVPEYLLYLINFIEFPLPRIPHLPESAETTLDLPSDDLRPYLRQAFDAMEDKLTDLIRNRQTHYFHSIVYDYAAYWVPPIAAKFGIPCAFFGLHNAAAFAFIGPPSAQMGEEGARRKEDDFTVVPAWVPFPSTIVYRRFEARKLIQTEILQEASSVSEYHRFMKSIEGCQIMLVRSCEELERQWLQLLGKIYEKSVVPTGLLPPPSGKRESLPALDDWLEKQELGSVVYVSFGTEVKLTAALMKEIALGLELSELPFVWAVSSAASPELDEFVERIEGRDQGRILFGWVPQAQILANPSVGGFLTHGGWSSIVEGLTLGKTIVVLPMIFDQGLNARGLVENGLGVEVEREEEDGSFTGHGIAKSLRLVMVEAGGEVLRAKAKRCGDVLGNEDLQEHYVNQLMEHLAGLVFDSLSTQEHN